MTNDEAKFVLRAYRPGGRDASDSIFAAALQQAKVDPILGAWFGREQANDRAVAAKLREVMPPAGLRERILAGSTVSQPAHAGLRRMRVWLAMAAGLAVILTLGEVWQGRRAAAAQSDFARFAVADWRDGGHHNADAPMVKDVLAMLARPDVAMPGTLALDFAQLKANGCRTVKFAGTDAIEICFQRDGTWYHLYLMEKGSLPRPMFRSSPALLAMNDQAVAVWSDRNFDYAVVSPKGMDSLKQLAG